MSYHFIMKDGKLVLDPTYKDYVPKPDVYRKVIRVENKKGKGPYYTIGYDTIHNTFWEQGCLPNHPSPHDDGLEPFKYPWGKYLFGFSTEQQFNNWFNKKEDKRFLHESGMHKSTYLVPPDYIEDGEHQLMFNCNKAEKINTESLVA